MRVGLTYYTYMCKIASLLEAALRQKELSLVLCGDREGCDGAGLGVKSKKKGI